MDEAWLTDAGCGLQATKIDWKDDSKNLTKLHPRVKDDEDDDLGVVGDDEQEDTTLARKSRRQKRKLGVLEDPKHKAAVTYLQVSILTTTLTIQWLTRSRPPFVNISLSSSMCQR